MLRLVVRFADEWNWWVSANDSAPGLRGLLDELAVACEETGRDPGTIRRSLDVFSVAAPGTPDPPPGVLQVRGWPDQMAEELLDYGALGFDEVRCNLQAPDDMSRTDAIRWMEEVVALVHAA